MTGKFREGGCHSKEALIVLQEPATRVPSGTSSSLQQPTRWTNC